MHPHLRSVLVAVGLVLVAGRAGADAVPPPPSDCPPGSIGETSHTGQWCAPRTCQTDANCKNLGWPAKSGRCRETSLCLSTKHVPVWNHGDRDGGLLDRVVVEGACSAATTCKADARCEKAMRCVVSADDDAAPSKPSMRGCGCGKTTSSSSRSGALAALLLVAWRWRRRARIA